MISKSKIVNLLKVVCLSLVVASLANSNAFASKITSQKTPFVATVQATKLNVRTGRSTGHRVIKRLKNKEEVVVFEVKGDWAKIPFPSTLWIYKKYLDINGNWGQIIGSKVNVRDLKISNKRSRVIMQAVRGDRFEIKSQDKDWAEVVAPKGAYAWTSAKYLNYVAPYKEWVAKKRDNEVYKSVMVQAEAQLKAQTRVPQERADYTEAIILFSQARQLTSNDAERKIIDLKIDQAKHNQTLANQLRKIQADKQQMASELNNLERNYKNKVAQKEAEIAALKQKENEVPTYISVGWITTVGRYYGRPAAFKLTKGSQVLYYLDASSYDLNLYINKMVGIKGTVVKLNNTKTRLIKVDHVDILDVDGVGFKLLPQ